jgi:hypothetical protein
MLEWLFRSRKADNLSPEELAQEIEHRRRQAKRCGVVDAFLDVYFRNWQYIASWIKIDRKWCHPAVTEAAQSEDRKRIELTVCGRKYVITAEEKPSIVDSYDVTKEIEVVIDDRLCLGVFVSIRFGEYADSYSSGYATAFITGPWVDEIKKISTETREISERNMKSLDHDHARKNAGRFGL